MQLQLRDVYVTAAKRQSRNGVYDYYCAPTDGERHLRRILSRDVKKHPLSPPVLCFSVLSPQPISLRASRSRKSSIAILGKQAARRYLSLSALLFKSCTLLQGFQARWRSAGISRSMEFAQLRDNVSLGVFPPLFYRSSNFSSKARKTRSDILLSPLSFHSAYICIICLDAIMHCSRTIKRFADARFFKFTIFYISSLFEYFRIPSRLFYHYFPSPTVYVFNFCFV